jgi:hypothetical protein
MSRIHFSVFHPSLYPAESSAPKPIAVPALILLSQGSV